MQRTLTDCFRNIYMILALISTNIVSILWVIILCTRSMMYYFKFSDLQKGNSRNNLWSIVKLVIVVQHKNILTCYIVTNVQPYVTFHGSINSTFSVSHQCLTHGHHFKTHKFLIYNSFCSAGAIIERNVIEWQISLFS